MCRDWSPAGCADRAEPSVPFVHCKPHLCIRLVFSVYPGPSGDFYVLAIGFMIVAELFNTAIEQAADAATEEYSRHVKMAKDVAAGGVLTAAATALTVGCILFLDLEKITYTLAHIFTNWEILVPCLLLGVADVLFLIFGGERNQHEEK